MTTMTTSTPDDAVTDTTEALLAHLLTRLTALKGHTLRGTFTEAAVRFGEAVQLADAFADALRSQPKEAAPTAAAGGEDAKDAARYRYIREWGGAITQMVFDEDYQTWEVAEGAAELDKHIDAALATTPAPDAVTLTRDELLILIDGYGNDCPISPDGWYEKLAAWRHAARASVQQAQQDDVHSCSYYCNRPECVKAQRDELRERYLPPSPRAAEAWREEAERYVALAKAATPGPWRVAPNAPNEHWREHNKIVMHGSDGGIRICDTTELYTGANDPGPGKDATFIAAAPAMAALLERILKETP